MAVKSAIEWTDATFNPWWGCERVSPACAHCYADSLARRYGHLVWGANGRRRFFGDKHWQEPMAWNRKAERAGVPMKVFCASMADVFEDHRELEPWRRKLWQLIEATPWLQWQLLTKRPENVLAMVPWPAALPPNVWIGTSIENSRFTFRADLLRAVPASVRFISAEPLLDSLFLNGRPNRRPLKLDGIHWVIAGGESGPRARSMDLRWTRELREACSSNGVAFFLKQLGGTRDKRSGAKARLDRRLWREFPAAPAPHSA
jgi:protein gp37